MDRYIAERKEAGAADATINRGTQILGQAFSLAVERKHLSAAMKIRHLSEKGNERQGFFSDAEFHAVLKFCGLPSRLCPIRLPRRMAQKRDRFTTSEDLDNDVLRLKGVNSKNREGRLVPLDGELAESIERRKVARQVEKADSVMLSAFIFHLNGEPVGDFRKAWATACVAAGQGKFICKTCDQSASGHRCERCNTETRYSGRLFHDLRRTAVRDMTRAGVGESVAMKMSGHKTRSVFDRYNIVNEGDLRDAMQRRQNYLKEGVSQQKRPAVMRSALGAN